MVRERRGRRGDECNQYINSENSEIIERARDRYVHSQNANQSQYSHKSEDGQIHSTAVALPGLSQSDGDIHRHDGDDIHDGPAIREVLECVAERQR